MGQKAIDEMTRRLLRQHPKNAKFLWYRDVWRGRDEIRCTVVTNTGQVIERFSGPDLESALRDRLRPTS